MRLNLWICYCKRMAFRDGDNFCNPCASTEYRREKKGHAFDKKDGNFVDFGFPILKKFTKFSANLFMAATLVSKLPFMFKI